MEEKTKVTSKITGQTDQFVHRHHHHHHQMSRSDDVMHITIVGECQGYKPQLKLGCCVKRK